MKSLCAWCSCELNTEESTTITHGICEPCSELIFDEVKVPLNTFINTLSEPVVVVDFEKNAIVAANYPVEIGATGGKVFNCSYADLPEGCGKTIHCDGCTIRNAVKATYNTGVQNVKIPAFLMDKLKFLISTELVNGVVLLRIDHADIIRR